MSDTPAQPAWKHDGVRVIPGDRLDPNTAQTPGMGRKAAINFARVGARKLWAGTVHIHPNAKTGAHHHGPLESVIYVVKGRARMRWGERLQFVAEAGPGDFIYVPGVKRRVEAGDEVFPAKLLHADGSLEELTLYLKNTSAEERELLLRGCLMNHYAAQRRE